MEIVTKEKNYGGATDASEYIQKHKARYNPLTTMVVHDIDFVIRHFDTGKIMMIEYKCQNTEPEFSQTETAKAVAAAMAAMYGNKWLGFHLLQNKNGHPSDVTLSQAILTLDYNVAITPEELDEFLEFEFSANGFDYHKNYWQ